ncbi:hypothetical protein AB0L99_26600 [Streptomyces sp. NPDC051954]|uniref:hypothetical protein n=1 Tax=unclassified Streptomyces TaxID=2593676 RepID=UPI0034302E6E
MRIRNLLAVTAVAAAAVLSSIGSATAEDEDFRGNIVQSASGNDQPDNPVGHAMPDSLPDQNARSSNPGVNRIGGIVQGGNPVGESAGQGEKPDGESPDQGAVGSLLGRLLS